MQKNRLNDLALLKQLLSESQITGEVAPTALSVIAFSEIEYFVETECEILS